MNKRLLQLRGVLSIAFSNQNCPGLPSTSAAVLSSTQLCRGLNTSTLQRMDGAKSCLRAKYLCSCCDGGTKEVRIVIWYLTYYVNILKSWPREIKLYFVASWLGVTHGIELVALKYELLLAKTTGKQHS